VPAPRSTIPASFAAAIDARLRSLSVGVAELVELAAVWGRQRGNDAVAVIDALLAQTSDTEVRARL
jgi:hypothetical protein